MKDKMPLVKDTLRFMVNQLKDRDRLGLVVYDEVLYFLHPVSGEFSFCVDRMLTSSHLCGK